MSPVPTIVAIEGIDSAGKTTQAARLRDALAARGRSVTVWAFPRYETFFGRTVRGLLDGRHEHTAETVDPRSMALWYALDRWEAFHDHKVTDDYLVLNRYTLSNAVYQSSRLAGPEADELFAWALDLEHNHLGLPRPDLTVVLDVPTGLSHDRTTRREVDDDRSEHPDVYERSGTLLDRARRRYLQVGEGSADAVVVPCVGVEGRQRPPEQVGAAILDAVGALGIP